MRKTLVLVVVAIDAEVLPVAAVGRVVVVVVVFVMHRELLQVLACERASATRTDPGMNPQRLLAVTG